MRCQHSCKLSLGCEEGKRDWAAVPPLAVDRGESPWFEALAWVCGNLVSLPLGPVQGGVHFVSFFFWAGLLWVVLVPVFSWGQFSWWSLFDLAGEEGIISLLCLVTASEGFIIESVMASSFPVDWRGANFGDGANTCLEWSCIVFSHPVSDGLAALVFNLVAFLVRGLGDLSVLFRILAVSLVQDLERSDDEFSDWDLKWFKSVLFFFGGFDFLSPLTIVHSGTFWTWSFDFDPGGLAALVGSLMIFLVWDLWYSGAPVCNFDWGDGVLFFLVLVLQFSDSPCLFPCLLSKGPDHLILTQVVLQPWLVIY